MNGKLKKVAEMIKKTFHTKDQTDCFDGIIMYVEEYYQDMKIICTKRLDSRFDKTEDMLKTISDDVKTIKEDLGLNGKH